MSGITNKSLDGRYTLSDLRASLPGGEVWSAEMSDGARVLAFISVADLEDAPDKVEAAMEACSEIDSPHVVPWVDGGVTDDDRFWLIAPWFADVDFSTWVTDAEGVDPSTATRVGHQIARALAAIHDAGQTHRTMHGALVGLAGTDSEQPVAFVYGAGLAESLPGYQPLKKNELQLSKYAIARVGLSHQSWFAGTVLGGSK